MAPSWAVTAALLISLVNSAAAFDLLDGGAGTNGGDDDGSPRTFIIRTQNDLKPSAFANVEQWYASTVQTVSRNLDSSGEEAEAANPNLVYVYHTVFHGFATKLTTQQADQLKFLPGVIGVFPDVVHQLQTTRSPEFLGLNNSKPEGVLAESDFGSDVIIGVLDTGIDPRRRSFSDDGLGPVPARWRGGCVEGDRFPRTMCTKKLIGARFFSAGYGASLAKKSDEVLSALDTLGHGTHTASTAAGRLVRNASFYGYAAGDAAGVAPKARIAVYKVCWLIGCLSSDILAAFDKAVEDGVDVISLSVGGSTSVQYNMDPIAVGAFGAMERGVLVSASAGNNGPKKQTLSNVAPWITTVGASTIDRDFPADLILRDGRVLTGASLFTGNPLPEKTFFPLYHGQTTGASKCQLGSLDPMAVRGKIVICNRGDGGRALKGSVVKEAGGIGVVVVNVAGDGEGVVADPHVIPGVHLSESAGNTLKDYLATAKSPRATIRSRGTQVNSKPAPVLASFSSRGPNAQSLYILKPDLTAPGVNILAAWPDRVSPVEIPGDTRFPEFSILSGTSMSCPHVSGIAALLKGAHPDWSPAMIRSAMVTTAYSRDHRQKPLLDQSTLRAATVWDLGAGHVDPQRASDPGLVYDLKSDDYLRFLCSAGYEPNSLRMIAKREVTCPPQPGKQSDLNYPSISVVVDTSRPSDFRSTVVRTVTHVAEGAANYTVGVANPRGAIVTVHPASLVFSRKGETLSYVVNVTARKTRLQPGASLTESGSLTWTDGKHYVTSPLLVVWALSV